MSLHMRKRLLGYELFTVNSGGGGDRAYKVASLFFGIVVIEILPEFALGHVV